MQGRSRWAVLCGLALFAVGQVVWHVIIEDWRREMRDPRFEIKYRRFEKHLATRDPASKLVVFFGSSMTGHGVKAGALEESLTKELHQPVVAFNMGTDAAGPFTHLLYVQRWLARGHKPDLVVIELSHLFHNRPPVETDLPRFPAHVLCPGELQTVRRYNPNPNLLREWWECLFVPVYGHRLNILHATARFLVPFGDRTNLYTDMDACGWRKLPVPAKETRDKTLAALKRSFAGTFKRYTPNQQQLQVLTELMGVLKKEQIPVMLVVMPHGALLRSSYDREGTTKLLQDFAALAHTYDCTFVNAHDWFDDDMFIDSYHLTQEGAERFTARLHDTILPALQHCCGCTAGKCFFKSCLPMKKHSARISPLRHSVYASQLECFINNGGTPPLPFHPPDDRSPGSSPQSSRRPFVLKRRCRTNPGERACR
jgi:hypothetical protein